MNDNASLALGGIRARAWAACRSGWSRTAWSRRPPCWTALQCRARAQDQRRHPAGGQRRRQGPRHRRRGLQRIRRAAVRPGCASPSTSTPSRLVSDKLLAKHRVLPLFRRGKRLFLGGRRSDQPARHRRDQVPDRPRRRGDRRRRRQAAEGRRQGHRAGRQPDAALSATTRASTSSRSKSAAAMTSSDDKVTPRRRRRRADRALRQQGHARCHPARRLGHPLRAVRKDLPRAPAHGRRAEGNRAAAGAAGAEARRAPQGHVAPRHRRAPRAAGRPHQDEAVQEPRHRLPRQHLPDAVRREDRAAYSRSVAGACSASTRWATSRSRRTCT